MSWEDEHIKKCQENFRKDADFLYEAAEKGLFELERRILWPELFKDDEMKKQVCIGIDPGNKETAVCIYDGDRIVYCDKFDNKTIISRLSMHWSESSATDNLAPPNIFIEDIQSMGMAVGQEVFDTAKMIGRMQQTLENRGTEYSMVKRTEIKLHHCGTTRAKDTNIRQALIDRFGDKGTKKEPGFFFGISGNDQWSACAIALYGYDKLNGR